MTELQKLYFEARRDGLKHHAALRSIARQTGLDKDTVDRSLKRARRDQEGS